MGAFGIGWITHNTSHIDDTPNRVRRLRRPAPYLRTVAPNGLIFLVVVAIWAAYLVQYWIRRRDHLATARSMDRFSESMRVLARRSALPQSSLETPAARSYAVSPTRSMRPQILVKRADVTTSHSLLTNQVAGSADSAHPGSAPQRATSGGAAHDAAPVRPATASVGISRRVRGLVLVALVPVLLVLTVLAALGALLWWAPLVALVALGCAFGWVRAGARPRRAARTRRLRKVSARPRTARPGPARAATATQPAAVMTTVEVELGAETEPEVVEPYGFEAPAPSPAVRPATTSPAPHVDDDDIPLTWDPRPVPRPTYTMKARADRPMPAPADVTPTPVGVDEDDDVRAVEPQRHTG